MPIEAAIVSLITGRPAVVALIGDRIGAAGIPQAMARPNIAYQLIGARGLNSNDGATGLKRGTLQVSCYADDYEDAKAIAAAITAPANATVEADRGLDGYSGIVGGMNIQSLFVDDERDAPEPPAAGQGVGVAGVILTFAIAYSG